jgi:peptidoglycan/LPS O-acetylase OafA/YrhL
MAALKDFKTNNFDLLRLLAATQVVFDHYFQHLNISLTQTQQAWLYLLPGVPVFFVISGYLIPASYERNNDLTIYLKNRILRIFPGLWMCLLLTIVVFTLTGTSFFNRQTLIWLPAQLVGLIYTPSFLASYGFGSYNGSLWTIPIELQFYLLVPVCYITLSKRKFNYFIAGLLIFFILLNIAYQLYHFDALKQKLLDYSFVPHFYLFLTGMLLQRLKLYNSAFVYNKGIYWLAFYIIFSLWLYKYLNPVLFMICKSALLSVTLLSLAYTLPHLARWLLKTNDISYGVYMYHGLILAVVVQMKWVGYINIYIILLLSFVLGFLSWAFVEKPFIKRKEKSIKVTL